jgi:hypothetical protein
MRRAFFGHMVLMLLGYALAVIFATLVALLALSILAPLLNPPRPASFADFWRDLPTVYLVGVILLTGAFALPGWLVFTVFAEIRGERRMYWFAAAGMLAAILAQVLIGLGRGIFGWPSMFVGSLPGGFAGGAAYWAVAGRRSGEWRKPLEPYIPSVPAGDRTLK